MGKNNSSKGKLNPVFRVAGGKAAKAKAKFKAQPVNTKLKQVILFFILYSYISYLNIILLAVFF
jgi:hypothetical protein